MFTRNVLAGNSATAFTRATGSTVESVSLRLVCRNRTGSSSHQRDGGACAPAAIAAIDASSASAGANLLDRIRSRGSGVFMDMSVRRGILLVVVVSAATIGYAGCVRT